MGASRCCVRLLMCVRKHCGGGGCGWVYRGGPGRVWHPPLRTGSLYEDFVELVRLDWRSDRGPRETRMGALDVTRVVGGTLGTVLSAAKLRRAKADRNGQARRERQEGVVRRRRCLTVGAVVGS